MPQEGFWSRLFNRKKNAPSATSAPVLNRESGWNLIPSDDVECFVQWLHLDEVGLPPVEGEEPSLGSHLLIELFGCDPASLKQEVVVGQAT